jgi:hypothetical protein
MRVEVRTRWACRHVEPAEVIARDKRAAVWSAWLEEGRYRSRRELATAVGVCPSVVTRVLNGR